MANITKTQIKKRIEQLREAIENLKIDVEELADEVREEAESVEPYDGKDNLTPQQEERQQRLNDAADYLEYATNNLVDAIDNFDYIE